MPWSTTSTGWPRTTRTPRCWPRRLQNTDGFALESGPVETNLVWVRVDPSLGTAAEVAAYLRSRGILVAALGAQVIRACTHLDVTRDDVAYAASVIRQIEPAMITAVTLVY